MISEQVLQGSEIIPHIQGLFESAGIKQFESLDAKAELVDAAGQNEDVLKAYIAASSKDLKVAMRLNIETDVLKRTIPGVVERQDVTDSMQEDWILELANQLMGRLKNKLLSHACMLQMGIPLSSLNVDIDAEFDDDGQKKSFFIAVEGGIAQVCLSISLFNQNLVMDLFEDEDEEWFAESELEEF